MNTVNNQKKWYISQLFSPPSERQSRVQLNPRTAIIQNESQYRMKQLFSVGTVVAILVLFMTVSSIKQRPTDSQATFDFKHSIKGIVQSVDKRSNSFVLEYVTSPDEAINNSHIKRWTVRLIPKGSCYIQKVFSSCSDVIQVGKTVTADYVFLNIEKRDIVVRSIIGDR